MRLGLSLPAPLPLSLWRPWEELIWVLIAALGLSLLGDGLLADLGLNLIVLMGVIYGVQGLAVLRFFAQRQRVPPLVELLFYVGLFFVAGVSVSALGWTGAFWILGSTGVGCVLLPRRKKRKAQTTSPFSMKWRIRRESNSVKGH